MRKHQDRWNKTMLELEQLKATEVAAQEGQAVK
jgi:hypothetical protein